MIKKDYIDGDYRVVEYENGTTVRQIISKGSCEEETINIPKSPLKMLEEENQKLKEDVETLSDALNEFMELTLGGDL